MFQKNCSHCGLPSFGSLNDEWICPHCKRDITNLPCERAETKSQDLHEVLKNMS